MARLVHRPITVALQGDKPHMFVDRGDTHVVETIVDWWVEAGMWIEGELPRTVYTLRTTDAGVYDIEHQGEEWFIYRVWD